MNKERILQSLFSNGGCLSEITARMDSLVVEDDVVGQIIAIAEELLNLFCMINWTGPHQNEAVSQFESIAGGQDTLANLNEESLQQLSYDGETPYSLCGHPALLYLAGKLLEKCRKEMRQKENDQLLKYHWWTLRCLYVKQRLLSQRSATLWRDISQMIEDIKPLVESSKLSKSELCELYLEFGHVMLYYSQYDGAQENFERACSYAGIKTELTGALGKRTKFQQTHVAQLLLKVTSSDASTNRDENTVAAKTELPEDLVLGDDTLLDHVQFADPQTSQLLSPLQQSVVLGLCTQLQVTTPVHSLSSEERQAYVNNVLATPQCWVVHCHALFLRCQLEKERSRTVERTMMQLQELVNFFNKPSPDPDHRLKLFYCTPLQPQWTVENELANVLVSLGLLKEALEIYERLELWEELVLCCQAVGRGGKAEEIVRQQLSLKETPTMWCLLGDVTKDPEHYTRAWQLSEHRSARAQKSLGLYYLRKERYKECIESLQLSLQINTLQDGLWFSLGCAANKIGDNDLAVKAFQSCVSIEPNFAEAWNNLAVAYLKRKEKDRAFRAYKEALKCSFNNWKIWENYLLVSTEVGEYGESIVAYHRLLDLKEKHVDVEILQLLVNGVVSNKSDKSGLSASRHRKNLGELLGRIVAQSTVTAEVWKLCADFHFASEDNTDHEKALLELQKAQRSAKLETGWERELSKLKRVVNFTMEYCQACRRMCGSCDQSKAKSSLSSAKLALQGIISKAKQFGLSSSTELEELIKKMEEEKKLLLQAIDKSSIET